MAEPFKKFSANSDFETWFKGGGGVSLPNWATLVTEDKEVHYSNSTIATSSEYLVGTRIIKGQTIAGDVYMYDIDNDSNFWMRPSIFTNDIGSEKYTYDKFQAIAVVVIPYRHNVYGTNEVGMVSLNNMRLDTPETGGDAQRIHWGGFHEYNPIDLTGLPNLNQVPVYESTTSKTLTSNNIGYLPSDNFTTNSLSGVPADNDAKYPQDSNLIPSPYDANGVDRNPDYNSTSAATNNALSDFDGKGNTDIITAAATSEDWEDVKELNNGLGEGYYPAACCCRRYKRGPENGTAGAGKWYLPAAGEGGYLIARLKKINESLTEVYKLDKTCGILNATNGYWLSTEDSDKIARYIGIKGKCGEGTKNNYSTVRAFLRA